MAFRPKPRRPWPLRFSRGRRGIVFPATSLPPPAPHSRPSSAKSLMFRHIRRMAPLVVAMGLTLLAGCGGKPDPNTAVMLIESSPTSLDTRIGVDVQSERIDMLIFDSLVKPAEHYEVQPWLAQSSHQPHPLTYVCHLRSDVRLHHGH